MGKLSEKDTLTRRSPADVEFVPPPRVLLLVEDNPGDADLVREMLGGAGGERYQIDHVQNMNDAVERLKDGHVDVVLLDLRLPDAEGLESVKHVKTVARETPIVVLTGANDEALGYSCIHAGAQDYLSKNEIHPIALRRAIGYALTRLREAQLRELQETLRKYRDLTSATAQTIVTAALAGTGSIQHRYPRVFEELVEGYSRLLDEYIDQLISKRPKPRSSMERLMTRLGDSGGGPRDLLDVHVAALDRAVLDKRDDRASALAVEGRLLALEMMGLLVDFYRVGLRRPYSHELNDA